MVSINLYSSLPHWSSNSKLVYLKFLTIKTYGNLLFSFSLFLLCFLCFWVFTNKSMSLIFMLLFCLNVGTFKFWVIVGLCVVEGLRLWTSSWSWKVCLSLVINTFCRYIELRTESCDLLIELDGPSWFISTSRNLFVLFVRNNVKSYPIKDSYDSKIQVHGSLFESI